MFRFAEVRSRIDRFVAELDPIHAAELLAFVFRHGDLSCQEIASFSRERLGEILASMIQEGLAAPQPRPLLSRGAQDRALIRAIVDSPGFRQLYPETREPVR